jgi:hypothetical protein
MRSRVRLAAWCAAAGLLSGACLMPRHGRPVFVDVRAGDFWSGEGLLTEVSPDHKRCRVSVRDRALVVRNLWVDCARVHSRATR